MVLLLTAERHQEIMALLKMNGTVKLQELVDHLQTSESTIRRDLSQLEEMKLLKRVHGGASLLQRKGLEPSIHEKQNKFTAEKLKIGQLASSFVEEGDCIYLDAGTTVMEMIPFLKSKNVTVLTNGVMHIQLLMENKIKSLITGGEIKVSTSAVVGSTAVNFISQFRFDKCFLGINGIHPELGFTTPDPDEALLKKMAISVSNEVYILADSTKLNESTFAKVADIHEAMVITDENDAEALAELRKNPKAKVVTA
ncbi:DeoR/GlpR family DNA-binding transcription regulator [Bacillus sp. OV322]|uniref:DeoR/GlpR family DNA-binding transcription regulator n=1 Tax=Bacillus sp. OV322 TaxID=1882764 RepID=UPI00352857A6